MELLKVLLNLVLVVVVVVFWGNVERLQSFISARSYNVP